MASAAHNDTHAIHSDQFKSAMIYCGVVNGFANEGGWVNPSKVELLQSKEFRALIGEAFLMLLLLSSHKWSTCTS